MSSDKLNKNSSSYKERVVSASIGSYFGLSVGAPTVSTNACTLVINQVNSPTYTGGSAVTATLPAAKAGGVCVFSMAEDPAGGTAALTFDVQVVIRLRLDVLFRQHQVIKLLMMYRQQMKQA